MSVLLTMGRILITFDENVETLNRLIVLTFHKNRISFDVIMTSFLFCLKVIANGSDSAQRKKLCAKVNGNNYAAPDCDTSDIDLLS